MNSKNNAIKINPYIVISIILLGIFIFLISSRLTFVFKNIEKVLIDNKKSTQTQKSFNLENIKELQTKIPLQP
jgi:hypothetical protein